MAQRIKVSTIAAAAPLAPCGYETAQLIEYTTNFWRQKFAQVLPDRPDLIVVPEFCDRYANHDENQILEYSRARGDEILNFFREVARENYCYLTYPAVRCGADGTNRNTLSLIDRSGEVIGAYSKNHVTIGETDDMGILCGSRAPIIECDFGRVACAICFDLNFDELRLQYKAARPDLILFSSVYHGGLMQNYWAYSCRAHFVAAISNCPSAIISPVGEILDSTTNYFDFVTTTINLDCRVAHLDYNADRLKALKEKYGAQVTITDPGFLGSVLITSESENVSAAEMAREFEIELLDDYLERALAHHRHPANREN